MKRPIAWCDIWLLAVLFAVAFALTTCTPTADPSPTVAETTASPLVPTPTLPPTTVPGSVADADEVAETVRQFGDAVTRDDEVVALLVLSPSAQQVVAASDLNEFLGRPERPRVLTVGEVQLTGDVATVACVATYSDQERRLRLQLVRLDGVWKIDTRVND